MTFGGQVLGAQLAATFLVGAFTIDICSISEHLIATHQVSQPSNLAEEVGAVRDERGLDCRGRLEEERPNALVELVVPRLRLRSDSRKL